MVLTPIVQNTNLTPAAVNGKGKKAQTSDIIIIDVNYKNTISKLILCFKHVRSMLKTVD